MKKIVLFGAKEFEKRLKYYIETFTDDKVSAFCVDREYLEDEEFCGSPIVASDDLEKTYPTDNYYLLIGIGYKEMNTLRRKKYEGLKEKGYSFYNFIHPSAHIDSSVKMGDGNIILNSVVIDYNTTIGNANIIESGTILSHECEVGDFNYFAPGVVSGGKLIIEDNCFFGLGAILRSAIRIKEYTLIGAGGYIDENTERCGVYVPTRKTKLEKNSMEMNIIYRRE